MDQLIYFQVSLVVQETGSGSLAPSYPELELASVLPSFLIKNRIGFMINVLELRQLHQIKYLRSKIIEKEIFISLKKTANWSIFILFT